MAIPKRYIGESIRLAITFINNVSTYSTISAKVKAVTSDEQVLKSVDKLGLVIDGINPKKAYLYIDASEVAKGYENAYNLILDYSFVNANYTSGFEVKKAVVSVFSLSKNEQIAGSYNDNDITISVSNSDVTSVIITSQYSQPDIDYNLSGNKPKINGVELTGDKASGDLLLEHKKGVDDFYVTNTEKTQGGLGTGVSALPTVKDVANTAGVLYRDVITKEAVLAVTARTVYPNLNFSKVLKSVILSSTTLPITKSNGAVRRFYIYGIGNIYPTSNLSFGIKYEDDDGTYKNVGNTAGQDASTIIDLSLQSDITNVALTVGFKFVFNIILDCSSIYPYTDLAHAVDVHPTLSEGELNISIANKYNITRTMLGKADVAAVFEAVKKAELLNRSKNFYDKSLQISGVNGAYDGYLNDSGVATAHATAKTTYYMPIAVGDWYAQGMYGFLTRVVTYGADLTLKRIIYKGATVTSPANDKITFVEGEFYVRFSIRDVNTFMLQQGAVMSAYESYVAPTIKPEFISNSKYQPLKVVCFGDSITDGIQDPVANKYATWTEQLASLMGVSYARLRDATTLVNVNVINMGSSGMRIAYQSGTVETTDLSLINQNTPANNVLYNWIRRWEAINTIAYTPTLFIIAAGTNDISQASDKGTFADAFASTSFVDDYNTLVHTKMTAELKRCILYLQKNYPNAQIMYCTPIHGTYGGRDFATLSNVASLNTQVANRMQTIICDNFNNSGINGIFENNPYRNTVDGVHPNYGGAIKFAKSVLSSINTYYKL